MLSRLEMPPLGSLQPSEHVMVQALEDLRHEQAITTQLKREVAQCRAVQTMFEDKLEECSTLQKRNTVLVADLDSTEGRQTDAPRSHASKGRAAKVVSITCGRNKYEHGPAAGGSTACLCSIGTTHTPAGRAHWPWYRIDL
jgi:hypothetical protein